MVTTKEIVDIANYLHMDIDDQIIEETKRLYYESSLTDGLNKHEVIEGILYYLVS